MVVLLLNEDKSAAHDITLRVAGYRAAPWEQQRVLDGNGSTITTGRVPTSGARSLPPNSLTEVTMHH